MNHPPTCAPIKTTELVRRFGLIVAGLAALVAWRFLRQPKLVGLIGPLFAWLTRSGLRFGRAVLPTRRQDGVQPARKIGDRVVGAARVRLPSAHAWLVRALGNEAAAYGSQIAYLLATAEMQAALAEAPGVGRILRPLCRMLGLAEPLMATPVVAAPTVVVPVPRQIITFTRKADPAGVAAGGLGLPVGRFSIPS